MTAEMTPLQRRTFIALAGFDLLTSIVLIVDLQIRPAHREWASAKWVAAMLAGTVAYWLVARHEKRRRMPGRQSPPNQANPPGRSVI